MIQAIRQYENWTVIDCEDFISEFESRRRAERHGWAAAWDHATVVSFQSRMVDPWAEEIE